MHRMDRLNLKVPPPLVALLCGTAMWLLAERLSSLSMRHPVLAAGAALLAMLGLSVDIAGFMAFRRHQTTINPLRPERTVELVTDGIYRYTRNPMYVGQLILLLAWAAWLAHPIAVLMPPVFVAYLTRFQILAEERMLAAKFGEIYANYKNRVRRWL